MARFVLEQRQSMSGEDSYRICDTEGDLKYICRHHPKKLRRYCVLTADGIHLFCFSFCFLHWGHRGYIYSSNSDGARIARFSTAKRNKEERIRIDSKSLGTYFIRGSIQAWDFSIYRTTDGKEEICAQMMRRVTYQQKNSYEIEVFQGKEDFMLLLCLLIDKLYYPGK